MFCFCAFGAIFTIKVSSLALPLMDITHPKVQIILSFQQEHQTPFEDQSDICAFASERVPSHCCIRCQLLPLNCDGWQAATAQVLHHKATETPSVHCLKALPMAHQPQLSTAQI